MNGDANVISEVPGRCSDRDNIGDHVSWKPAGEQKAYEATTCSHHTSESNTLRNSVQRDFPDCLNRHGVTDDAENANLLALRSPVELQTECHEKAACTFTGQGIWPRSPGSLLRSLRFARALQTHIAAHITPTPLFLRFRLLSAMTTTCC